MAPEHDFGFDATMSVGININYCPAWDTGPIEDEGEHELVRDMYGVVRRIRKDAKNRDVAQYVSFPMSGRSEWEQCKSRLAADAPGRFPDDWEVVGARGADSHQTDPRTPGRTLCMLVVPMRIMYDYSGKRVDEYRTEERQP